MKRILVTWYLLCVWWGFISICISFKANIFMLWKRLMWTNIQLNLIVFCFHSIYSYNIKSLLFSKFIRRKCSSSHLWGSWVLSMEFKISNLVMRIYNYLFGGSLSFRCNWNKNKCQNCYNVITVATYKEEIWFLHIINQWHTFITKLILHCSHNWAIRNKSISFKNSNQ